MKKFTLSISFAIFFATIAHAGPDISWQSSTAKALKKIISIKKSLSVSSFKPQNGDLVVGYLDPNEIVTISGDYSLDGDILIVNNGILNIDSADFKINGDIRILGHGQMNVTGGTFTVVQEYIYEHDAFALESGELNFHGVTFQSSGQSWSNAFIDSAYYSLENCQIEKGFITTALLGNARAKIADTQVPGEFLCFSNTDLQIKNSDLLLIWLVLPDESSVDMSLPADTLISHWTFSATEPEISGIPYTMEVDSCTNVMWGLMSMTGSDATFRDSEFRTIGMIFTKPDSITVENITNESKHTDDEIAIPDRNLRLVNTEVHTWSFYAQAESKLTVQNCVFGELLAQDSSRVQIFNSVCDGTGGYLGAFNQSELLVIGSLIRSQVISRNYSVLVGAEAAFWGSEIDADESSVMLIANTATSVKPEAHSNSIIFEMQIPRIEGPVDDLIPVIGTAQLIKGPENPIQFDGYDLAFAEHFQQPNWRPMGIVHKEQVINDTLEIWNTSNLESGLYAIRLRLFHSFGEPIAIMSSAYLSINTDVELSKSNAINEDQFYLSQNYPNPFNSGSKIQFHLPTAVHVKISIFDIRGSEIATVLDSDLEKGIHEINFDASMLPSGVFFYRMTSGDFAQTRKFMVIK
ncbi:MAG: T9SS type A sorting domain-containing protein [Calditrichaeota bacterium]|nr:T9SS type A sorting domain-containing protein [Calditrichota bacterium]